MKIEKICCILTVYFEDPFWVGVFEKHEDKKLYVSKVTFGAEPKDYEVYDFILKNYFKLKYSPAVTSDIKVVSKNPKKMQRDAKKQISTQGIGTKSQQALKLLQEQNKTERKIKTREQKLLEEKRQFSMRQQKKKEKHKGH